MKIIDIQSALPMDGESYFVGEKVFLKKVDEKGEMVYGEVTEIKDFSTECDDGSVDRQYDIYVDGQVYKSFVNMPVRITYELEESK